MQKYVFSSSADGKYATAYDNYLQEILACKCSKIDTESFLKHPIKRYMGHDWTWYDELNQFIVSIDRNETDGDDRFYFNECVSVWAPNIDDLKKLLKYVYEDEDVLGITIYKKVDFVEI